MFERFDADGRALVVAAQEEARGLRHDWIGTEHLLLGVLRSSGSQAAEELGRAGVNPNLLREQIRRRVGPGDADALRAIGIDLEAVVASVEQAFGPGALDPARHRGRRRRRCRARFIAVPGAAPFTPRAKKVLELALRHALRLRSDRITPDHVVLGLLTEGQGLAAEVLVQNGVDLRHLQARIEEGLKAA